MTAPALRLEGLTWSARSRRILDRVDLVCRPGRVTGLLGPNGSGKTTLLHLAAGVRRASAGRVLLDEVDVRAMTGRERSRQLALVEQEARTGLDLSVRQVVALGRIPHRGRWGSAGAAPGPVEAEDARAVEAALTAARVEHLADRSWRGLSGGERQRTHLARALAQQPRVLLLDEPTNHLDLGHQLDFLARVRELGLTTVAALHDLELAAAYCDDLAVLDEGRLVAAGPVADVLSGELVARVFGVDASVEPHPGSGRPHVRWNGPLVPEEE